MLFRSGYVGGNCQLYAIVGEGPWIFFDVMDNVHSRELLDVHTDKSWLLVTATANIQLDILVLLFHNEEGRWPSSL